MQTLYRRTGGGASVAVGAYGKGGPDETERPGTTPVAGSMEQLEERIAHLIRAVEDLSDVVTRQGRELDRLTRMVALLAQREAEREDAGEAPAANAPPPHW